MTVLQNFIVKIVIQTLVCQMHFQDKTAHLLIFQEKAHRRETVRILTIKFIETNKLEFFFFNLDI